jgi:hypothetical protein
MNELITIDSRFNGPPTTGNGGYVCGLLANFIGNQAEVTLLKPPPLDRPLSIAVASNGSVQLRDGESIIAVGEATSLQLHAPAPPTYEEALEAASRHIGLASHAYPTCFVCGPDRDEGDGLRIFAGRIDGTDFYAAHWTPLALLSSDDGLIASEFIWAALDCPGYFAVAASEAAVAVLGRFAVNIINRPRPGENCVVLGWKLGKEGRKRYAGTALFSQNGTLFAKGRATWYDLEPLKKQG